MKPTVTTTPTRPTAETTRQPTLRRKWFILGLAALLLMVAGGAVGWWIGTSGGDDTARGAEDMPEILEEFYDALIEGDATAMAALFSEDGGFTGTQQESTRSDYSSPQIMEGMVSLWFSYVDYTDVEHLDVIVEDNTVVVVSGLTGMSSTHQRASKTPFSATVADVFELRDGLIAQCDMFFDYNDVVN